MTEHNRYYATQDRNGTEDEITIYTPEGRRMLCVAFWDKDEWDDGQEDAGQIKADVEMIVNALNAYSSVSRMELEMSIADSFYRTNTVDREQANELAGLAVNLMRRHGEKPVE